MIDWKSCIAVRTHGL